MAGETITEDILLTMMKNTLTVMEANEKYLTELDSQIGDADHGVNITRGFKVLNDRLSNTRKHDISAIFNTAGTVLMEAVGGTSGALFGTMYIKAAQTILGKKEIDKKDLATMFEAGLNGVQKVGNGARPGDKTMVDALEPAVRALKESACNKEVTLVEALEKAVEEARKGMIITIPLIAKKGRASYLGERSIGHQDPLATSTYLVLRVMIDTLKGKVGPKVTKYGPEGAILEEIQIMS